MDVVLKIQQGILGLGPGEYQRFCADYIIKKKGYKDMHDIGIKEGTNKTTKGIPDSYNANEDGTYSLIMYGTVSKKDSIKKIEADIIDAASENKTGIDKNKIKEIICFHINTNMSPGEYDRLINLHEDINIELIDIYSMAYDINENYLSLAYDYFDLPIDTNQITDINDFIKRYDKFSANSPLSIEYIERKEKEEIINIIRESEELLLIKGKPGIGKTKITIEICRYFEEKEGISCLCIRPNGENIYKDIKTRLENDKDYLIFVDDINDLYQFKSFIDCIITNKNKKIKIVATIRSYLLNEMINKLNCYNIKYNVYELDKMEDIDIIKILENSFDIKNEKLQQQILKISNGNPRVAIMVLKSIIDGTLKNLNSILEVFKNYYEKVIKENNLSKTQIEILFYIAFLSPFSIENEEIKEILKSMEIYDIEEYKELRNLELIEFYRDKAIKISDQNFANYIIYKYLIEMKTIKISDLLIKIYPKFMKKFINAINMIYELFSKEGVLEYIKYEINSVWEKDEYKNEDLFLKSFHNLNIPKTLNIIKGIINSEKQDISQEIKYKYNKNDEMLGILADIKDSDYSKIAFELMLSYLKKRLDLCDKICENIKDCWLMKRKDLDFKLEKDIISILFDKHNENDVFKYILIESLKYCLRTEFNIVEQGKDSRTINFSRITLQPCKEVFQFRKFLFDIFIKIYHEDSSYINFLMDHYIWVHKKEQSEIIKIDIEMLERELFSKWKNPNIHQCVVLNFIEKKCENSNIPIIKSLYNYKNNKEYLILKIFEEYNYNQENIKLNNLLSKSSVEKYKYFFEILKNTEDDQVEVDCCRIQNSINLMFEYIIKHKNEDFEQVFQYYLNYHCPFKSMPNYLFLIEDKYKVIELLIKSNSDLKYFFLRYLFNSFVEQRYLENIKNFLKEQNNNEKKYTLNLRTILKYSEYDSNIIDYYTNEVLKYEDVEIIESYTSCLSNNLEEIQKIYDSFKNKQTLEQLYLKIVSYNLKEGLSYIDYKGYMGFILVKNNFRFFKQIIKNMSHERIDEIIKNIWKDEDSFKIISDIYNEMLNSEFFVYLRLKSLFNYSDDDIRSVQKEWLKEYIRSNNRDKEKMKYIFYLICEIVDQKLKEELILLLLDLNSDFEIFKDISFFPMMESWSNSMIPLIENKIEFLEDLKREISKKGINYISHIDYITSSINKLKEEVRRTEEAEYLDDFWN